ncbi:MAG: cadherin-like domain-containing protein [Opitutaceae bacterium]
MKAITRFFSTLLLLSLAGITTAQANVPEPSTLIYGKVLHRAYGSEHQLVEGSLVWTLRDQNGLEYTFNAELEDIKGVFSYRIEIPHQALSSGLNVDPSVIPLGVGEMEYEFVSIEVDGYPAAILWSQIDFLKLFQNSRAATHRIDLLVSFDLLDTDGDGMPDWWEKFYGLDWQNPDAALDSDGDGWNNLEEYYNGTNPLRDDRAPIVQTLNLAAYGESDSGVWLRSADVDTVAADLTYTLTALPDGGHLHYVSTVSGGAIPEYVLAVGESFTQAQLNAGEVAYRHSNPTVTETSFSVSLSDGINEAYVADIEITVFPPSPAAAVSASPNGIPTWWRDENIVFEAYWGLRENVISGDLIETALLYLLGKDYGWTIWDQRAQTLPVTLDMSGAGSHFLLGGVADDVLRGGAEDDIISGGAGLNTLAGGAGLDLFIVGTLGDEIIEDFNPAEDVLDLADLLIGQSGSLDSFLLADSDGTDTNIRIDQNGDGSGFTDAVVLLQGVNLVQEDLHRLWSVGQLLLGSIEGFASISIEGWPTESLEEGFSTAELILRRNGPASSALTVGLDISGNATNGSDYTTIPASVSFGAGSRTVTVLVEPILDVIEDPEQINLGVANGAGYVVGSAFSGQIQIADAKQRFSIVAVESNSVVNGDEATLLIQRNGPKTGFVQIRLGRSGSAIQGTHYSSIPSIVDFQSGQGNLYLPVQALGGGSLASGETSETLIVNVKPAFAGEYFLGDPTSATVRLLSNLEAFDSWAAELPEADTATSSAELQATNTSRTGLKALLEYAFSYGIDLDDGVAPEERSQLRPLLERSGDGMHFEFTKRLNDNRLEYIVECSPDLVNWNSGPDHFESIGLNDAQTNSGRVRYRVRAADTEEQCFIRVRVILND